MAAAALCLNLPSSCHSPFSPKYNLCHSSQLFLFPSTVHSSPEPACRLSWSQSRWAGKPAIVVGGGSGGNVGGGGSNGGSGGNGDGGKDGAGDKNRTEALLTLAEIGRSLDTIPSDLASAIRAGRIPGSIVRRFAELEGSPILKWLLQFGGFKERLLADDLFLAKVGMECGVGIFTKTAAEWERRRENFVKEIDFVIADLVMAIIADFMLVWLPAPTVSLRPPLTVNAGSLAKFFYSCPDNAFQVALAGTSYSFLQRIGAIARNGSKLFVVGTSSSLARAFGGLYCLAVHDSFHHKNSQITAFMLIHILYKYVVATHCLQSCSRSCFLDVYTC
ncbi:protein RETICULATA-RELATED 4, chloroplastic-like isoform X2 [Magnolia sinica]|uniref:protein RETICULATA-RELATED 4, chloroplastic-like isoform X2 n=1 Tax=Magnolia sinica TaxID=86752 RepID=UPI0026584038|nr:protein RETICULATA-RELATED 4, chloroplastic-like isoform X2 [Magnolia sinica]